MAAPTATLEVQVFLTNGRSYEFHQDSAEIVAPLLAGLQPQRLFTESQILVAGAYVLGGFRTSGIEAIRLTMGGSLPEWQFPPPIVDAFEITAETFGWAARHAPARERDTSAAGELLVTNLELELASGRLIYGEQIIRASGAIDQRNIVQHILSHACLQLRVPDRGALLINSANVCRFALYPGPPQAPANAWQLHRVDPDTMPVEGA